MPTQIDLSGLKRLTRRIENLGLVDFQPLMKIWGTILQDDNRAGALAGLDGNGDPLARVTYRPKRVRNVNTAILPNNNLTSSHYRSLSGPPLAPRRENSRIITNFRTSTGRDSATEWHAQGAWKNVLDTKDRPFLRYHFIGAGRLPKRDLRGVRPAAVQAARRATRRFMIAYIRSTR